MTVDERIDNILNACESFCGWSDLRIAIASTIREAGAAATAAERERCLAAVGEVRERVEKAIRIAPGAAAVQTLTRGALKALEGVRRLVRSGEQPS